MKPFLALLAFASALSLTTALLRHNDNIDNNDRHLQQECALRSTYMGCYADKKTDRALPIEIMGRQSRDVTPAVCEAACASAGYNVWGRQFKGQCFCGDMGHDEFGKHGMTSGCDCCGDNVGGNKFCAYAIDGTAPGCGGSGVSASSTYVGCFRNKNNARALPVQVPGKGWSAVECEMACRERDLEFFAREWKGQCFCGSGGYDVHGTAEGCDCCGGNVGGNKMCVWHSLK